MQVNVSSWLLVAGIGIMTWVLLRRASRARKRLSLISSASSSRQAHSSDRPDSWDDKPREMSRWRVEMYDVARDMRADMDTKMRILQALIGQAQQQAQRLEAAIDKAERLGIAECRDTLKEIKRVTSQPPVMDDVNTCMDSALPRLESVRLEQNAQFRDQVFALADRGLSAETIADQTGATLGEVEMSLSLRRSSK